MPTLRAIVVAAVATLALAVAAVVPGMASVVVACDVLLIAAIAVDARRARAVGVRAARRWPPLLVQGARAEVSVRVAAERPVRLVLREALHPAFARQPLRQRVDLPADAETAWRYELFPRRRGEHLAGPLTVRVLGPWGLAWSQRELLPGEPRRVFPQIRWQGRVGRLLALAHRRELGRSPLRVRGRGSEPYALREYRPGDPPTRIQWKASARHARLLTREDAWERGSRLLILLDCARAMASLDGERSKLDDALAAALALTRVAVSHGDRVTLVAFSDRIERTVRVRSGARGVGPAYGALFDLEARAVEPAYDVAAEAVGALGMRGATVVMMSSVVDLAAAELLREALVGLSRSHRSVLINLEDADVVRLALGVPVTRAEAFAKVSSLELLLANRRLARTLQRAGIVVVGAAADQLAWRSLATYLGLSPGGRLTRSQGRSDHSGGQLPPLTSGADPSVV